MTSLTARKRFTNNKKTKQTWEYVLSIPSNDVDNFGNSKRKQLTKSGFKTKKEALEEGRKLLELYQTRKLELRKNILFEDVEMVLTGMVAFAEFDLGYPYVVLFDELRKLTPETRKIFTYLVTTDNLSFTCKIKNYSVITKKFAKYLGNAPTDEYKGKTVIRMGKKYKLKDNDIIHILESRELDTASYSELRIVEGSTSDRMKVFVKLSGQRIINRLFSINGDVSRNLKTHKLHEYIYMSDNFVAFTLPVLLDNLRAGDTVIVVEVFRLYRSFRGLEEVYRTIVEDKKCEFITLNPQEQILCTSNQDKEDIIQQSVKSLILVCMALFSSLEKKNISERTKRSLKQRKDSGKKLGRPTVEVPEKYAELFKLAVEGQRTHAQNMREFNLKKTSYYKIAKELGLKTNKRNQIFE